MVFPERFRVSRQHALFADRVQIGGSSAHVWLLLTHEVLARSSSWLLVIRRWRVECEALRVTSIVRVLCQWDPLTLEPATITVEWEAQDGCTARLSFQTGFPRQWVKAFRRVGVPVEGYPTYSGLRRLVLYLDVLLPLLYLIGAGLTMGLAFTVSLKWQPTGDARPVVYLCLTLYGTAFMVVNWFLFQRPHRKRTKRSK